MPKSLIALVAVLIAIISGWYLWHRHHLHQPIGNNLTTMDFDTFQEALADRVRTRFNVAQGSVVVADVAYDVGTLLDPVQTYPSDYSDCAPTPVPPTIGADNLFPSYQLSSSTAVQTTLGSNALQKLTSASVDLAHNSSLVYSIDQVSVQFMDLKTLDQLAGHGACGTYVAQHPGSRLIRGVVMGRISFTLKADNPGSVKTQLAGIGGGTISTDPDSSTVTVADDKSTQILQMLAVVEAPTTAAAAQPAQIKPAATAVQVAAQPPAAPPPEPQSIEPGHPVGGSGGGAPHPQPVAMMAHHAALPMVHETATPDAIPAPTGNYIARIFFQQDASAAPDAGTKVAQALKAAWPQAFVAAHVESVPTGRMPSSAQVRFFNATDNALANTCRDHLKALGIDARVVRIGITAPQTQLEVWLPKSGS